MPQSSTSSTEKELEAPAQYKFVVGSAEEAVKVLRSRLGENAKVISVKQVDGVGLARFLRAPKLEIIAQAGEAVSLVRPKSETISEPVKPEPTTPPSTSRTNDVFNKSEVSDGIDRILRRVGMTKPMIAGFKAHPRWEKIATLSVRSALEEIATMLRADYQKKTKTPLGNRVAFIGTAGVGKTTALCKRLAMDVFLHQKHPSVLKLDAEKANPGEGLGVFCDVLGVPLLRSSDLEHVATNESLYVDLPGVTMRNKKEMNHFARLLTELETTSRVLIVNAAYDVNLLKEAYRHSEALQASHVVFTHLDELLDWGKLWEFIVGQELNPLFLSSGQNIAGDINEEVFDSILIKTFP